MWTIINDKLNIDKKKKDSSTINKNKTEKSVHNEKKKDSSTISKNETEILVHNEKKNDSSTISENKVIEVETTKQSEFESKNTNDNSTEIINYQKFIYIFNNSDILEEKKKKFKQKLLTQILSEDIDEDGFSDSADIFEEFLKGYYDAALIVISEIFTTAVSEYKNNRTKSIHIICGVLNILSQFPYRIVKPIAPPIAVTSTLLDDINIIQTALFMFANWRDKSALSFIQNINYDNLWINKLKMDVIKRLESENNYDVS